MELSYEQLIELAVNSGKYALTNHFEKFSKAALRDIIEEMGIEVEEAE